MSDVDKYEQALARDVKESIMLAYSLEQRRKPKYWDKYRIWYVVFVLSLIIGSQALAYLAFDERDLAQCVTVAVVSVLWWITGIVCGRGIFRRDD